MQFADLRVLLLLPRRGLAPQVGANATATAMICNQISGFSEWFFYSRFGMQIAKKEEARRKELANRKNPPKRPIPVSFSAQRFQGFVRAYYPRVPGEPPLRTIAAEDLHKSCAAEIRPPPHPRSRAVEPWR